MSASGARSVTVGRGAGEVATLGQAHAALRTLQPASDASAAVWAEFFYTCSRVYATLADLDRVHHHEALGYYAARTREIAEEITASGKPPQFRFTFN